MSDVLERDASFVLEIYGFACRDFANLYPSVLQDDLSLRLERLVKVMFLFNQEQSSVIGMAAPRWGARAQLIHWVNTETDVSSECIFVSADFFIELVTLVVKNLYVKFSRRYFKIVIGFPIGRNCGRELADAYLFAYEFGFLRSNLSKHGSVDEPLSQN